MAEIKRITLDWSETGITAYYICRREVDDYRMDDSDGDFATAPADPYQELTEDSVIKGRYEADEARVAWNDGRYTFTFYKQDGGSPVPASDTVIGTGEMIIKDDLELLLGNTIEISGNSVAANNLELQYDGTGVIGDTFPATQAQVGNLTSGSAAISKNTYAVTITTGVEVNAFAETEQLDGIVHEINPSAGNTEFYYSFNVGGNGVPVSVTWQGYANSNNDSYAVKAKKWSDISWKQIGTIEGGNGSTVETTTFDLTIDHVGVGVNLGEVQFQITSTDGTGFNTDRLHISYAVVSESVGYANGAIWYNSNANNTNTEVHVDGTADNPVSTWAAVLNLSAQLNMKRIQAANGSAIILTGNSDNFVITGQGYTLDLNGQSIIDSYFFGGTITGIGIGGGTVFEDCPIGDVTLEPSIMRRCFYFGTITNAGAGDWFINEPRSRVAGSGSPIFDFGTVIGDTNLNIRGNSGGWQLESMGDTGTDTASIEGWGQVIEGTCTGGVVVIRGNFTTSGITNLTLSDDARFALDQFLDFATQEAVLSRLASSVFGSEICASAVTVTDGTILSGTIIDTQTINQTYLKVQETGKWKIVFDFTGLSSEENSINVIYRYFGPGSTNHVIKGKLWNYNTSVYDDVTADAKDFPSSSEDVSVRLDISGTVSDYFDGVSPNITAKGMIEHESNNNTDHQFWVDFITLGELEQIYVPADNIGISTIREVVESLIYGNSALKDLIAAIPTNPVNIISSLSGSIEVQAVKNGGTIALYQNTAMATTIDLAKDMTGRKIFFSAVRDLDDAEYSIPDGGIVPKEVTSDFNLVTGEGLLSFTAAELNIDTGTLEAEVHSTPDAGGDSVPEMIFKIKLKDHPSNL